MGYTYIAGVSAGIGFKRGSTADIIRFLEGKKVQVR